MPSKSVRQAKLMAMVSHNPAMAKKTGVPVKVAKEYNQADAGTGILKGKGARRNRSHQSAESHK